jgi:hypothetical protein
LDSNNTLSNVFSSATGIQSFAGMFTGQGASGNTGTMYFGAGEPNALDYSYPNIRAGLKVYQSWNGSGTDVKFELFTLQSGVGYFTVLTGNANGSATFGGALSGTSATFSSSVTATSLIKSGGTSSQFLMADGSVNTSVLPSGAYLPLTGGTLTGALGGTSASFSSSVTVSGTIVAAGADILGSSATSDYGNLTLRGGYAITTASASKIEIRGFEDSAATQGALIAYTNGTERFRINQAGTATFTGIVNANNGAIILGKILSADYNLISLNSTNAEGQYIGLAGGGGSDKALYYQSGNAGAHIFRTGNGTTFDERMRLLSGGNLGLGTATPNDYSIGSTAKVLQVTGSSYSIINANAGSVYAWLIADTVAAAVGTQSNHDFKITSNNVERMRIKSNGVINIASIPTSSAGLSAGDIWSDSGTLKIV